MIRKLIIALGATAVVAAAALAPTAASAGWKHKHHGHGHGHGYYGYDIGALALGAALAAPAYYAGADCYIVRRPVMTPYGKRWRNVQICN